MKRDIIWTSQFKKDYKLALKPSILNFALFFIDTLLSFLHHTPIDIS